MTTPIDDAWRSYAAQVLPPDAPEVQRVECRRAFFGGAVATRACFDRTPRQLGGDLCPINPSIADAIDAELRAFRAEVGTPAESPVYGSVAQVPVPHPSTHRDAADCLHCRISAAIAPAVVSRSINDVLGHIAEVVGELLAGVADRNFRRQLLRGTADAAWRHAGEVRRSRVAAGVPDLEVREHRIH